MAVVCVGFLKLCSHVPGDWVTYEDIVQKNSLTGKEDEVPKDGALVGFNGRRTIAWKTKLAFNEGVGGVMIWEVGQDCRVLPVTRGDTVHVKTCPQGEDSSLLAAITNTRKKYKPADATKDEF